MKSKVIIPLATTLIVSVSIVLTIFVGFSKPTINDVVLDENIEALSQSDNPGMFDDQTAWFSILSSGDCGYEYELYTVSWSTGEAGAKISASVYSDPKTGKLFTVDGDIEFTCPTSNYTKEQTGVNREITGHWKVCEYGLHTCDRALQELCDGTTSTTTTLNRPSNAL